MRALTLHPEWVFAIFWLGKDIENRSWIPRLEPGEVLAIHAGKHVGGRLGRPASIRGLAGLATMARCSGWDVEFLGPQRRIVSFKKAGQCFRVTADPALQVEDVQLLPTSQIVGCVQFEGVSESVSSWAVPGQLHWRLSSPQRLMQPAKCGGSQGLWAPNELTERFVGFQLSKLQENAKLSQEYIVEAHEVVNPHADPPSVWPAQFVGSKASAADAHQLATAALQSRGDHPLNAVRVSRKGRPIRLLIRSHGRIQEVPDDLQVIERLPVETEGDRLAPAAQG